MARQPAIRVYIIERDIYARQAIASYLSWDRHTRVVGRASSPHGLLAALRDDPSLARLDAIVLDNSLAATPDRLATLIKLLQHHAPQAAVICLAHHPNVECALSAQHAGARAFYTREQVGIGLASGVRFALAHLFSVTENAFDELVEAECDLRDVDMLPERRTYPRLTQRIEEALWLCVVEGLPAERAAEEMGVSTSTVRSYIKEGYRILEAADDTIYPATMSPSERAFLRYSAIELPEHLVLDAHTPQRPAA